MAPQRELIPPALEPSPPTASKKRWVREHHEEREKELFEGASCSYWSIKRFVPPSQRESHWDNL